ncbi:hypothetical protein [Pedobacter sp. GR22-6]|uniref:hypothetical protein n=1 Tax=Pedobacter sp. GR22-6 TaxID=3127957 RepID=UPI00307F2F4D
MGSAVVVGYFGTAVERFDFAVRYFDLDVEQFGFAVGLFDLVVGYFGFAVEHFGDVHLLSDISANVPYSLGRQRPLLSNVSANIIYKYTLYGNWIFRYG